MWLSGDVSELDYPVGAHFWLRTRVLDGFGLGVSRSAAQADVNRELYTQQTAAQAEAKRLRLKITKLNLEIGRNQ